MPRLLCYGLFGGFYGEEIANCVVVVFVLSTFQFINLRMLRSEEKGA